MKATSYAWNFLMEAKFTLTHHHQVRTACTGSSGEAKGEHGDEDGRGQVTLYSKSITFFAQVMLLEDQKCTRILSVTTMTYQKYVHYLYSSTYTWVGNVLILESYLEKFQTRVGYCIAGYSVECLLFSWLTLVSHFPPPKFYTRTAALSTRANVRTGRRFL